MRKMPELQFQQSVDNGAIHRVWHYKKGEKEFLASKYLMQPATTVES